MSSQCSLFRLRVISLTTRTSRLHFVFTTLLHYEINIAHNGNGKDTWSNDAEITAHIRLIADGSGYKYAAYFDRSEQIIHMSSIWWVYDFESEGDLDISETGFFLLEGQCAAVNRDRSENWLLEVSEIEQTEAGEILNIIELALDHR